MRLLTVLIFITLELFIPNTVVAAEIPLWDRLETVVVNSRDYENPFKDVELDAEFTSPSGKKVNFFGFYDGDGRGGQEGSVWKLRFMPNELGKWSYACRFSDGAPGTQGTFTCTRRGAKPGPLRTQGPWLRFADGTAYYPRSYYLSEVFSGQSPHWEQKIDLIFGDMYKYNMCCTTFWQGKLLTKNVWNNLPYNEFHPVLDGDYMRLDLASWKHVDEVLERLASRGTIWYNFDGFIPNVGSGMNGEQREDFEAQKVYIRNVVARLAPNWNVTWNIVFEWWEFLSVDQIQQLARKSHREKTLGVANS